MQLSAIVLYIVAFKSVWYTIKFRVLLKALYQHLFCMADNDIKYYFVFKCTTIQILLDI